VILVKLTVETLSVYSVTSAGSELPTGPINWGLYHTFLRHILIFNVVMNGYRELLTRGKSSRSVKLTI
jgi:hypothetical protein